MALRINIPPVTRILLVLILSSSFLYTIARWSLIKTALETPIEPGSRPIAPYLALIPSLVLYYPWTLFISTFVEQNVVTLSINGTAAYFGGKYLERAWGSKSFGIAILVTSIIPNLIAVPIYIFWGAVMGNVTRASTPITGGITLQAAFLVAFKQLVPEHTVSVYKGMIKMRVKHFPAIFLAINTISGLILGTDTALILAWLGLLTSWTYLRFFKRQPDLSGASTDGQGLKGDASETFAFATFFPNAIQPLVGRVCDQGFLLMCRLRLLTPFSDEAIATGNEQAAARGEVGLPSFVNQARGARGMSKREEAERRRALALRALDQRLNASSSRPTTAPTTVTPTISSDQEALGQTDYKPDDN